MARILILPGDGIGSEITDSTETVLAAANERFDLGLAFEHAEIGFATLDKAGTTFPAVVLDRATKADGIVLGPVSHNDYPPRDMGGINPSGALRIGLDLFANIRPAHTRAALPMPAGIAFDIVIYRENTEGFYTDRNMASGPGEFMPDPDMALAIRKVTRRASARIAEAAFAAAAKRPAQRVTAVHKANVLRASDGLFLDEARRVAALYPQIDYDEVLVDAMAAHLVREPHRFDVIVTTNMYGDILSDLAGELSGGLGTAASLNMGADHAMAQAQHGSAPSIAGKGVANPAGLIGSAAQLLQWLGMDDASRAVTNALETSLSSPKTRTPDLGGTATTDEVTQTIVTLLKSA